MAHTPGSAIISVPAGAGARRRARTARASASRVVIDDVSKLIIEQLQQDGRRSYAAIGKAVGLSEAAVRQREFDEMRALLRRGSRPRGQAKAA